MTSETSERFCVTLNSWRSNFALFSETRRNLCFQHQTCWKLQNQQKQLSYYRNNLLLRALFWVDSSAFSPPDSEIKFQEEKINHQCNKFNRIKQKNLHVVHLRERFDLKPQIKQLPFIHPNSWSELQKLSTGCRTEIFQKLERIFYLLQFDASD